MRHAGAGAVATTFAFAAGLVLDYSHLVHFAEWGKEAPQRRLVSAPARAQARLSRGSHVASDTPFPALPRPPPPQQSLILSLSPRLCRSIHLDVHAD